MKRILYFLFLLVNAGTLVQGQRTLMGTIQNARGEPVIGATILVADTTLGTVADTLGNFRLEIPASHSTVAISYTGYESQRISLGASNVIDVILVEKAEMLDEAVVIGYGFQSRRNVTSSISSVDELAFKNVSVQGFEQALHGRMPGVVVTGNSGTLGAQQAIRVRGVGSVNASNQPLYVIDGIILNNDVGTFILGGGPGSNPLININPSDIETLDVLKDAAASAVYGSRGANGVIIITTKEGNYNQEPVVNLGFYTGFSNPTKQFEMLNGKQYAELWNRGMTYKNAPADQFYDVEAQPNTDWFEEVSQSGIVSETNASLSGGSVNSKFYLGGTYRDENGWLKTTNLKRYSFRINFEQKFKSNWVLGMMLNPSRTSNQRQFEDATVGGQQTYAAYFFPNVEARDENGNVRSGMIRTSIGRTQFPGTPLANLTSQNVNTTTNQVLANTYVEFNPFKKLKLRTEFGTQIMQVEDFWKGSSVGTGGFDQGRGRVASQQVANWTWNNTAVFQSTTGQSEYDVTLGYFMNREDYSFFTASGQVYADDRLETLYSAAQLIDADGTKTAVTFAGGLGRINYSFANKYLLSASVRMDGSSRFGANNCYGYFPAFSAGWILSDENFWSDHKTFSFLKLRASWGVSGNAGIENFTSLSLISSRKNYNGVPGLAIDRIGNADLEWEKNETMDLGVEFGLFRNHLSGSLVYYNRNTYDLLLDYPIPQTTGIFKSAITRNAGEVINRGMELTLSADILQDKFEWNIGLNLATVYNEVLKLADTNDDGLDEAIENGQYIIKTGVAIGSFYLVEYAGVDIANGDALFYNLEGTASKDYNLKNRIIAGSPIPKISGGITSQVNWLGIDLSLLWQFAADYYIYREEATFIQSQLASVYNQTIDQLDAWTPEHPNSKIPQARGGSHGNQHSTRYLSKADFIRLKNIQLGYTLPPLGTNKTLVRFFAAGQNLLTFTQYEGLDPEASRQDDASALVGSVFYSRPQSKTITMGVNITL